MNNRDRILRQHQSERTRCTVYTRVMGYHRPVESFNSGKQGEHAERTYFREPFSHHEGCHHRFPAAQAK